VFTVSAPTVSPYIPDIGLITWYAEKGGSFLSRVSPWTKLAFLVLVVLFITVVRDVALLLGLYLAVLALYALARLPVGKLLRWYLLPLLFVLSLVGLLAWTQPGIPVLDITLPGVPLVLTDQGVMLVMVLTVKTLTTVTCSLLFLMTTRYEHLAGMISRIFPSPLDQVFLMAYRFLFLTLDMAASILKAFRSRGGELVRGIRSQGSLLAGIIGLLFIRSFDRAERVHRAMVARGYQGSYASGTRIPSPAAAEYAALGLGILALAAALVLAPAGGW
jgi:cobalt/nickel transport system permease protein